MNYTPLLQRCQIENFYEEGRSLVIIQQHWFQFSGQEISYIIL